MTKRILITAGLVAALAGGGAVAMAQAPQDGGPGIQRGPGRHGGPGARMRGPHRGRPLAAVGLRGVTLTDAQREQVRSVMESHKAEFQQAATRLREAHRGFAEAVRAEALDENTVRARSTAIATAMADDAILRAKVRAEVQGLLTAEQLQQINDRKANAQKLLHERQRRR